MTAWLFLVWTLAVSLAALLVVVALVCLVTLVRAGYEIARFGKVQKK